MILLLVSVLIKILDIVFEYLTEGTKFSEKWSVNPMFKSHKIILKIFF